MLLLFLLVSRENNAEVSIFFPFLLGVLKSIHGRISFVLMSFNIILFILCNFFWLFYDNRKNIASTYRSSVSFISIQAFVLFSYKFFFVKILWYFISYFSFLKMKIIVYWNPWSYFLYVRYSDRRHFFYMLIIFHLSCLTVLKVPTAFEYGTLCPSSPFTSHPLHADLIFSVCLRMPDYINDIR